MVSTCADVVRRGLRAMGAVQAGKVPAGIDAETGMEYLQSLILSLPGLLKNAHWREVAISTAYTPGEGERCTVSTGGSVTPPTTITDCRTGRTRPPLDLARVQILGSVTNAGLWVWSAAKGAWAQVDALTLASDIPFGEDDVQPLAMMLAVNIAAEYGAENDLGQRTLAMAVQGERSFRSRLKRAEPRDWSRPNDELPSDLRSDFWY